MGDVIVHFAMLILDRHIFHLALDAVETQTMGNGGVEEPTLMGDLVAVLHVLGMVERLHEGVALADHTYYNAYILREGEHELAEVLVFQAVMFCIEVLDLGHARHELGHLLAKVTYYFLTADDVMLGQRIEQHGERRATAQTHLVKEHAASLHQMQELMDAMAVAAIDASLKTQGDIMADELPVGYRYLATHLGTEAAVMVKEAMILIGG